MHLLISGIPATGKSTFSRWLATERGYKRCPSSEEPDWSVFFQQIDETRSHSENVVIDCGFPVNQLSRVRDLIASGVQGWWFDGDRDAAFGAFQARVGHPATEEAWYKQLADIGRTWDDIQRVFEGRILNVIRSGPVFMSNEDKWQLISSQS